MRLTLSTPPADQPVTLASAKAHCRVDHSDDDSLIEGLIAGVVSYLDGPSGILGRAIMPQTWTLELSAWQSVVTLPIEPVRTVAVTYLDQAGDTQTLAAEHYSLSAWPSHATELRLGDDLVRPALQITDYPVSITINAGAASAEGVEPGLQTAILMLVGHWYENREAVVMSSSVAELPLALSSLLARYRRLV